MFNRMCTFSSLFHFTHSMNDYLVVWQPRWQLLVRMLYAVFHHCRKQKLYCTTNERTHTNKRTQDLRWNASQSVICVRIALKESFFCPWNRSEEYFSTVFEFSMYNIQMNPFVHCFLARGIKHGTKITFNDFFLSNFSKIC